MKCLVCGAPLRGVTTDLPFKVERPHHRHRQEPAGPAV